MLWYTNHALYKMNGVDFEHPSWTDMVKPKEKDDKSGAEIVEDLKAKMLERKKQRERRG